MRIFVHTWPMWGTLSISAVLNCSRFIENGPSPGYHVQLSCLSGGGNLMWGWCWPPNSCRRPTTSTMWTGACANLDNYRLKIGRDVLLWRATKRHSGLTSKQCAPTGWIIVSRDILLGLCCWVWSFNCLRVLNFFHNAPLDRTNDNGGWEDGLGH